MAKNPRLKDITGERFGMWLVRHKAGNHRRGGALWLCHCDCGVDRVVLSSDLRSGKSASCGCSSVNRLGDAARTHASSTTRLYSIWKLMRGRCTKPYNSKFRYYGGRGIVVCTQWEDFPTFQAWALANGYQSHLTIERNDVNGNYEPSNCCWATVEEQSRNKTNSRRAPDGELWVHKARRNGVKDAAFRRRIFDGWPADEASTVPMGHRRVERVRDESGRYS